MQGDVWASTDHCFQFKAREQGEERDGDNPGHIFSIQICMEGDQIPAHSLPHSSYRLVKLMEAVVQSQSGVLGSVLGGDSSVPDDAEMMMIFWFYAQGASPIRKMNLLPSSTWC